MNTLLLPILLTGALLAPSSFAGPSDPAASATNELGLDLYRHLASGGGNLCLPKFRIEGPAIPLKKPLGKLGMKLAFNRTLADFGRMTSDQKLPGLFIDNAYHKTFIAIDEEGTEAAAATAIVIAPTSAMPRPEPPVEVRVDRPFFYAIMDTSTRTALFLGRVTDPR